MSYYDTIIADSPFAYWRLGESSGTTADNAEGTASYDGTYTNGPALAVAGALAGDADTSVTFDAGTSEYVDIGALGSLGSGIASDISIEFWLNTTSSNTTRIIRLSETNAYVEVTINESIVGSLYLRVADNSAVVQTGYELMAGVNDGVWHHIVATFDASQYKPQLYVDGQSLTTTDTGGRPTGWSNYTSGRIAASKPGDPGDYLNGTLDEVAVYNNLLTSLQVTSHYNTGIGAGAAITSLGLTGTPSVARSFSAKANVGPGQHTPGRITQLALNGLSGGAYSFSAKDGSLAQIPPRAAYLNRLRRAG